MAETLPAERFGPQNYIYVYLIDGLIQYTECEQNVTKHITKSIMNYSEHTTKENNI